ncbi:MAG: LapA family protein [Ignavibacteriaceae bacterium]|nr:LapA family protein [Ignavibacteriaceae bacterium]
MKLKLLFSLILGLIILIIIIQNVGDVPTKILFWSITLPHIFLLFIVFIIGLLIGIMLTGLMTKKPPKELSEGGKE